MNIDLETKPNKVGKNHAGRHRTRKRHESERQPPLGKVSLELTRIQRQDGAKEYVEITRQRYTAAEHHQDADRSTGQGHRSLPAPRPPLCSPLASRAYAEENERNGNQIGIGVGAVGTERHHAGEFVTRARMQDERRKRRKKATLQGGGYGLVYVANKFGRARANKGARGVSKLRGQ